jgi:hypothetical protein
MAAVRGPERNGRRTFHQRNTATSATSATAAWSGRSSSAPHQRYEPEKHPWHGKQRPHERTDGAYRSHRLYMDEFVAEGSSSMLVGHTGAEFH